MERGAGKHEPQARNAATSNVVAFTPRPTRAERHAMGGEPAEEMPAERPC